MRTTLHEQLDTLAQLSALCRLSKVAPARATHALLEALARADGLGFEVLDQL